MLTSPLLSRLTTSFSDKLLHPLHIPPKVVCLLHGLCMLHSLPGIPCALFTLFCQNFGIFYLSS